ncbi:hypothetical protein PJWF_00096 [Achromobacter phage JWF]|uniref:hypothetical protein n=1 Tax=Achromobacter phage JWF TaxID=1589748 RepID=UPI000588DEF8|nr:hypothetical protein AXJ13_gp092 [Achromobacter phage JWF]AJD82989.1 hypothetical protein PJWF_00096 [Achromobacter phage JWF]
MSTQLKHVDGWNGGHWEIEGKRVVFGVGAFNYVMSNVAQKEFEATNRVTPVIEAVFEQGLDIDMGHRYEWTAVRLKAYVNCEGHKYSRDIESLDLSPELLAELYQTMGLQPRTGS